MWKSTTGRAEDDPLHPSGDRHRRPTVRFSHGARAPLRAFQRPCPPTESARPTGEPPSRHLPLAALALSPPVAELGGTRGGAFPEAAEGMRLYCACALAGWTRLVGRGAEASRIRSAVPVPAGSRAGPWSLSGGGTSCARQRTCSWRRGSGRGGKSKWAATAASAGGLKFKAGRVGCVERPLPRPSLVLPRLREGVLRAAGAGMGERQGSARDDR